MKRNSAKRNIEKKGQRYLTTAIDSGLMIIHSSPVTLSWVPRDVVNHVYNVGGTLTVGTFGSLDKQCKPRGSSIRLVQKTGSRVTSCRSNPVMESNLRSILLTLRVTTSCDTVSAGSRSRAGR